jgi:hypothetical protein
MKCNTIIAQWRDSGTELAEKYQGTWFVQREKETGERAAFVRHDK